MAIRRGIWGARGERSARPVEAARRVRQHGIAGQRPRDERTSDLSEAPAVLVHDERIGRRDACRRQRHVGVQRNAVPGFDPHAHVAFAEAHAVGLDTWHAAIEHAVVALGQGDDGSKKREGHEREEDAHPAVYRATKVPTQRDRSAGASTATLATTGMPPPRERRVA